MQQFSRNQAIYTVNLTFEQPFKTQEAAQANLSKDPFTSDEISALANWMINPKKVKRRRVK